ncbi:MAG: DUF512 domain-containing protein [Anaerolineae bacterium]
MTTGRSRRGTATVADPPEPGGGTIAHVAPGSIAEDIGMEPGDRVLQVDGKPLRDVIDLRYLTASGEFELLVRGRDGDTLYELELDPGEPLGLDFDSPVFDGLRSCCNDCCFCFVSQMPPGLRSSLYVRDDDYRLSFLYGNFITLTNLKPADWRRLYEQHLSPLYVSVHATEQPLRDRLLGLREKPPILEKLRRLADHGLRFHAQLVLIPGLNDGKHLERSLADLLGLGEAVLSVSVVPVGLTRFASAGLRRYSADEATTVVRQVAVWRRRFREAIGRATVYAADEWYLMSGQTVPGRRYYEGFPQAENGVGLTRLLLDRWASARRRLRQRALPPERRLVVCGTLIAPTWQAIAAQMDAMGACISVLPVSNRALGESVTVSGLLFAEDTIAALAGTGQWAAICLPRSMFSAEGVTLDGYTPAAIAAAVGGPVIVCDEAADVLRPLPARGDEQVRQ